MASERTITVELPVWICEQGHHDDTHLTVANPERRCSRCGGRCYSFKSLDELAGALITARSAALAAPSSDHQGGRGHRVVIEFDGESIYGSLLHPESGCQPSIDPETGEQLDDECWIQGWFDEYNAELLHGKVEIAVQEEWDGDSARLFVVSPTGDPQRVGPPTPDQPPAPRGLSEADRKELRRIADIIGDVHRPCADPDLHENDARFLRKLADQDGGS